MPDGYLFVAPVPTASILAIWLCLAPSLGFKRKRERTVKNAVIP